MSTQSPEPGGPTRTQRRLLGIAAGIGVAVIMGALFTVTYGDLKTLAVAGHASHRLAPAYPVMYDALVLVAVLALAFAWRAHWWPRSTRWALLLVLLAGAGAAAVDRATQGYDKIPHTTLKAGVAAAPEVILLLAVWLWLGMFRHARSALATRIPTSLRPEPPITEPPAEPEQPAVEPAPSPDPEAPELIFEEGEAAADHYEAPLIPGFAPTYEPRHQAATFTALDDYGEPEPTTPIYSLPTDVRLVSKPEEPPNPTSTTIPDIVLPTDLIPAESAEDPEDENEDEDEEEGEEEDAEDRAEDPDAGNDTPDTDPDLAEWSAAAADDVRRWAAATAHSTQPVPEPEPEPPSEPTPEDPIPEDAPPTAPEPRRAPTTEWPPPSSTFRSSPTPPDPND